MNMASSSPEALQFELRQGSLKALLGGPDGEAAKDHIASVVFEHLGCVVHDRTGYGSFFARADNLWFQCQDIRIDFTPEKELKSGLTGQDMVPEPDTFSFTTHCYRLTPLASQAAISPSAIVSEIRQRSVRRRM